jgi:hypothetical protein
MSHRATAVGRTHRVLVAREQYKFSCAHMTVFPDGTKERLHGHNYQRSAVDLELLERIAISRQMLPFAAIKDVPGRASARSSASACWSRQGNPF